MSKVGSVGGHAQQMEDLVGMPPQLASVSPWGPSSPYHRNIGRPDVEQRERRIDLKDVGTILARYGLDPIERVAQILTKETPVLDRSGNPVLDKDGNPMMKPALDDNTAARTCLELAQYQRPKLKAVEVTSKDPALTEEQIDRRLDSLYERVLARKRNDVDPLS